MDHHDKIQEPEIPPTVMIVQQNLLNFWINSNSSGICEVIADDDFMLYNPTSCHIAYDSWFNGALLRVDPVKMFSHPIKGYASRLSYITTRYLATENNTVI